MSAKPGGLPAARSLIDGKLLQGNVRVTQELIYAQQVTVEGLQLNHRCLVWHLPETQEASVHSGSQHWVESGEVWCGCIKGHGCVLTFKIH